MKKPETRRAPRVVTADRRQMHLVPEGLEGLLPGDHTARAVWSFVEKMELGRFYEHIKSVEGTAGRDATDPKVLIALLLYAAMDGVGSAREIERLTETEDAYRWIRGGVPLNHHMLSDFRVGHRAALDELLTQSIAVLLRAGVVTLRRVAQDGTKIRASAGSGTFRREPSLRKSLIAAQEQLEWVRRDAAKPDAGKHARALAAQKRAAEEKMARVQKALDSLPLLQSKQDDKKKEPRASTTDPDARIMKTGDGGFRPAYNVQFATDADGLAVVGVAVTQSPADSHQMPPMLEQIEARTGAKPHECFVDNGYSDHASIEAADAVGVTVYAPLQKKGPTPKDGPPKDPAVPTAKDSEAIVHFRLRMATAEAKQAYKIRGQVAELTNADVKGRQGLTQVLVRGLPKVTSVVLWSAIALNLTRMMSAGLL
jgi:transposase